MVDENPQNQAPQEPSKPKVSSRPNPSVAASPARNVIVLIIILIVSIIIIINLFVGGGSDKSEDKKSKFKKESATTETVVPPPPPTPPSSPPPPPPPPPTSGASDFNVGKDGKISVKDEKYMNRVKSNMLLSANQSVSPEEYSATASGLIGSTQYVKSSDRTKAEQAKATVVGSLEYMIAQGKVIDATLETAINTDLPGQLRAVVNRDTYAESGKGIMIPKGSRLIGTYNANIIRGQARIYIVWQRVIRPDGIDIAVASPGIDQLGRAGTGDAIVDDKFLEIFGNAVLMNIITVGIAKVAENVTGAKGQTETRNSDNSRTTSGSPTSQAITQAITNTGQTIGAFVANFINVKPTIYVDQGTRLKVFVNRDLIFPPHLTSEVRLIQ